MQVVFMILKENNPTARFVDVLPSVGDIVRLSKLERYAVTQVTHNLYTIPTQPDFKYEILLKKLN